MAATGLKITKVDAPRCTGGENPLWDRDSGTLYYIDNSGHKIHAYRPCSGDCTTWNLPDVITTLALCQSGRALVTMKDGIQFFDFRDHSLQMVSPLEESSEFIFNDGKVDRNGRFVVGGSTRKFDAPEPDGGLFSLGPDGALTTLFRDIFFSNGPCFSPDDRTLYFSDSWLKTCFAYDYDLQSGTVKNPRRFADTTELGGLPDGATVDSDGNVWIAIYGGGKVVGYDPRGLLVRVIEMPVKLVSSLMFGGQNLDKLYVTTIEKGAMGEPVEADAGSLYVIENLGVRGVPEPKFPA